MDFQTVLYPGSCNDSFTWSNTIIQDELKQCYAPGDHHSWLLEDSGYPQQPWLMSPILNSAPDNAEDNG